MIEKRYKLKRTKIVGTIGPTSTSKKIIRKMILAGLNLCRINFSHSNHENALNIITIVNELRVTDKVFLSIDRDRTVVKTIEKIYFEYNLKYNLCFANGIADLSG